MLFADKAGVFNRFMADVMDVLMSVTFGGQGTYRFRTDDSHVVLVRLQRIQRDMLTDQEANTNARHVEPIEKLLNALSEFASAFLFLPFKHTLSDGRDRWVVSLLDVLEHFGESIVVVVDFGWVESGSGRR